MIKRVLITLLAILLFIPKAFSEDAWINDLRGLFLSKNTIIYEINIRTFGASDANNDGIIDFSEGEESGTFLNAISRLDELKASGVNVLHVMPIMEVGKIKALGTAGSLYAAASFNKLNPQLKSEQSALSVEAQAIKFINEAHKRQIRVVIDLPACASYDLYLKRPELFLKDVSNQPVVPADWTDVRILDAGSESKLNVDVYDLYKEFVDYVMFLGADGIRADVAAMKPQKFWQELIGYSRKKDTQFLWLAESSQNWTKTVSGSVINTSYDKLLGAGFDGFYGNYFNMKDWRTAAEFINNVKSTNLILSKYKNEKSVIGSFTTHDELSPILLNGESYAHMIIWLNATLPLNPYYVDGFSSGDNYIYLWANKKARKTYTDDDYYFVHRGKLDIFNFSRRPGGKNTDLLKDFTRANNFRKYLMPILSNGTFAALKTNNPAVFAYSVNYQNTTVVVVGNINFRAFNEAVVDIPHYTQNMLTIPVKIGVPPISEKGKLKTKLTPGEVQVLLINGMGVK